jgi:hypothetical protein
MTTVYLLALSVPQFLASLFRNAKGATVEMFIQKFLQPFSFIEMTFDGTPPYYFTPYALLILRIRNKSEAPRCFNVHVLLREGAWA